MIRLLAWSCLIGAATIASAAQPAAESPTAELQGRWTIVSCNDPELRGDPDQPNRVILTFDGDTFTMNIANDGGTRELAGGYSLDPAPTPKLIDFTVRGESESTTVLGIYRVSGSRLMLRWRTDDIRPGDFTSPKAEFDTSFVFRREQ